MCVKDTPSLVLLSLLLMCIFSIVLSRYLRSLMDDRVGILYYCEIIILILIKAFLYDCNIQHQRCCGLESENRLIPVVTIELSYLCPSYVLVSLHSISLRCVDFKLHGNVEILVILPLWQIFNVCEAENASSKNMAGVQRWTDL